MGLILGTATMEAILDMDMGMAITTDMATAMATVTTVDTILTAMATGEGRKEMLIQNQSQMPIQMLILGTATMEAIMGTDTATAMATDTTVDTIPTAMATGEGSRDVSGQDPQITILLRLLPVFPEPDCLARTVGGLTNRVTGPLSALC